MSLPKQTTKQACTPPSQYTAVATAVVVVVVVVVIIIVVVVVVIGVVNSNYCSMDFFQSVFIVCMILCCYIL